MRSITHIILHTAAWPGDPSIHDIYRVHVIENGWRDVGYHYLIRKDGTIEVGRHESQQGAHSRDGGMNPVSIGICMSGHHDREHYTQAQASSLVKLSRAIMRTYHIPIENFIGHREAGAAKTCPGTQIDMDAIRGLIHEEKGHHFGI